MAWSAASTRTATSGTCSWIARRRSLNWINVAFFRLNAVVSSVFLLTVMIEVLFEGGFKIK